MILEENRKSQAAQRESARNLKLFFTLLTSRKFSEHTYKTTGVCVDMDPSHSGATILKRFLSVLTPNKRIDVGFPTFIQTCSYSPRQSEVFFSWGQTWRQYYIHSHSKIHPFDLFLSLLFVIRDCCISFS